MVLSSSISTPTSSSQLPTLFQVMALTWSYQRLVGTSWGVVFRMTRISFLAWLGFQLLNWILKGFAPLALLLTAACLVAAYQSIRLLATSKESQEWSLWRNRVRLPLFAFVVSCLTSYFFLGPFFRDNGLDTFLLLWAPQPPSAPLTWSSLLMMTVLSIRVTAALTLLGVAVVGRYIGPKSFMRCSSVPLLINPFDEGVSTLKYNLLLPLQPRDGGYGEMVFFGANTGSSRGVGGTGEESRHSFSEGSVESDVSYDGGIRFKGRRFQHAPWTTIVAQAVLAFLIGCAVASTSVWRLGFSDKENEGDSYSGSDNRTTAVVLTCAFVVTLSVMPILLDIASYELDPLQCYASNLESIVANLVPVTIRNAVVTGVSSLVITMAILYVVSPSAELQQSAWSLSFNLRLGVCSVLMSLYLAFSNDAIKAALFDPGFDFERLANEFCEDSTSEAKLDAIMNSLLYSTALIREVSAPSTSSSESREEVKRVQQHSEALALILLSPVCGSPEAPLEEDVMRVSILNALGGTRGTLRTTAFADWFTYKCPGGRSSDQEPLCMPLVRSLCVFVRAVGEALLLCSSSISRGSNPTPSSFQRWFIPPGLVFCADCSVKSLSWCIVQSMSFPGQPMPDWKSSLLSAFVPVALTSIFHLRRGITIFFKSPHKPNQQTNGASNPSNTSSNPSAVITHPLAKTCDDAARDILKSLHLPKQPIGRANTLALEEECFLWTKNLLTSL